jgi:prefoldin subunit 5
MAAADPAKKLASEINSLRMKFSTLEQNVRLASVRDTVEDTQTTIKGFAGKVAELRTRGYVFGKNFESRAEALLKKWQPLAPNINKEIEEQARQLQTAIAPVRTRLTQLAASANNPAQAQSLLTQVKPQVESLEAQVTAVSRQISGMYDSVRTEVNKFNNEIRRVDYLLTNLSQASFQLLATEAGVAAVKAVWAKDGKEKKGDPQGVLYLTDQRIIFEQKEEVATKKVLFIATEKEKRQKLLIDVPVALVKSVETSKQGMLKNEDFIKINFESGAPMVVAHFHIWQPCEEWQGLINRAKARDFESDRAVEVDADAAAKVKSAPTQCPTCGGHIHQVILRGQDSIKCEFCGFLIRL